MSIFTQLDNLSIGKHVKENLGVGEKKNSEKLSLQANLSFMRTKAFYNKIT